jgi:nucleoside 2-deoxyribosyltransferase
MIKGCCSRASLDCSRADEITQTGRITEQIVRAISNADIVIADITRANPNVLWELGFADGLGRTVIVLNQGASSPFDLHDLRQIRYKSASLNPASRQLSQFLRSAIEELRQVAPEIVE